MRGPGSGEGLLISGGGGTLVATDAVLAEAAVLRALQTESESWRARLARIRALESSPTPAVRWTDADPGLGILRTDTVLADISERSRALADALLTAAEGYGRVERVVERASGVAGAWLGYLVGRAAPLMILGALPNLAAFVLGGLVSRALFGDSVAGGSLAEVAAWFQANPGLLSDPAVVAAVRVLVSSADDAAVGALGLPFPAALELGDEGLGLLGVSSVAVAALLLVRPFGLLVETPVSVHRVTETGSPVHPAVLAALPPDGFGELARRIPDARADGPQIRIERYAGNAGSPPSWIVYVGGTAEWDPTGTGQPFDLTSDVAGAAAGDAGSGPGNLGPSGSYRAVVEVMHAAGVQPQDPVLPVGHSLGGQIAVQLAESGEFNTVGVASFGGPTAALSIPAGVEAVTVEHTDDIVPAFGGMPPGGDDRVLVRSRAFAAGEAPAGQALPAHSLTSYQATARLMDGSAEPNLLRFRDTLAGVGATGPAEVTRWHGIRVTGP
ncbi:MULTISPECIES: hypothetical protein [unclassified Cryobacterium]|uniref:hypothetical protein n=2 Tax=Bacteria TaxID=2 RepID=UPI002AB4B804|nr:MULTISPECIES: hypothetical protein [unclassified Cryobacterium]MDY7529694.1 hypothetical protein [Cryobacterium sp. 10C2]MDY7558174.1 hypothetical protein [Cryobacterium sp. 10C3]MEB0202089.1 hypothetical protein [Cryobacterium sp. 5I3]MEB0289544.1 hypothetical protein [Cryobacterium sp. 10C2]